jgi:hypothetical protein
MSEMKDSVVGQGIKGEIMGVGGIEKILLKTRMVKGKICLKQF